MLLLALHPGGRQAPALPIGHRTRSKIRGNLDKESSAAPPRIAVFGGRGFIGSRVCRTLVEAGCDVVSISLSNDPPEWAKKDAWIQRVAWLSVDSANANEKLGSLDAAVSCVGNVRPSLKWDGFWGLHWDDDMLRRQNGDINEQIATAAKHAGARRFAYVSVSSDVAFAYGGALEGYIDGKAQGEQVAQSLYGDDGIVVGPSLVYGGGRFAAAGKIYEAVCSSFATTLFLKLYGGLQTLSSTAEKPWELPQDMINKVALTPPVDVDTVARAIAAAVVGATSVCFIDGSKQIQKVSEEADPDSLRIAAAQLANTRSGDAIIQTGTINLSREGAPSLQGAPFEGALVGARPLLYPLPVAVTLGSVIGYALSTSRIQ